ncbi:hypothetical protein N7510_006991 [Penicillium lagena]|uniref:uncharacterized protein n=1 Tax=Penicillium lagena TaxID=94218 RepID=UPI002541554E|nr:uncharacterized protein N7510_006991 [Penicillium lagena]KAJ5610272.1 hypothetical protein N7510_006991 [Penicillium lagena]
MPRSDFAIQPLPPDVAAKIKSSTSITHLNGVVLELVKNALDANAHTVFVTVDVRRGSCIVEDDGDGILPTEFESSGGLGKAHHTSKLGLTSAYGHRGLFLASLAALSLLTITSHHAGYRSTNSLLLHHSTPVARLIPAPVHQELQCRDHGTCVTVNDLFGNMPVRVKSRALALQRLGELDREWDSLRYLLVALMVANPQLSKLVLHDAARNKKILIRLGSRFPGDRNSSQVEDELDLKRIGSILAQSGIASSLNLGSWHTLSASLPDLTVRAAVSLTPSPSKKIQFISLGTEPVFSHNGSNILYSEANRLFAQSDFGHEAILDDSSALRASPLPERPVTGNSSLKGGTRSVNKWPMFYIRVDTSSARRLCDDGNEILPESDNSLQRITDVLGVMISEFLKQHGLRPRMVKRRGQALGRTQQVSSDGQKTVSQSMEFAGQNDFVSSTEEAFSSRLKLPSFQKPKLAHPGRGFNSWSRVKAAKNPLANTEPQSRHEDPEFGKSSTEEESWLSTDIQEHSHATTEGESPFTDSDAFISWVEPATGKAHLINSRTGQTMIRRKSIAALRPCSARVITDDLRRPQSAPVSSQSVWVENLLKEWNNPVFRRTEKPISRMSTEFNHRLPAPFSSHDCLKSIGSLDTAQVSKFRGKLERHGLENAEVISQVDCKFILVKVNISDTNDHGALVLIDQHAADERCRVEQLFRKFFLPTPQVETIGQNFRVQTVDIDTITFEVSSTEGNLFKKYSEYFLQWGVHYNTELKSGSSTAVLVTSLPSLIAERCRLEPKLVIDLLRREIWTREDDKMPLGPARNSSRFRSQDWSLPEEEDQHHFQVAGPRDGTFSWVQQLSGCPQSIIDLLNSRACRSAIMFNDALSMEECQTLVSRLARCVFPFQCAHGRPSMVPILDLRSLAESTGSARLDLEKGMAPNYDHSGGVGFLEAFQTRYSTDNEIVSHEDSILCKDRQLSTGEFSSKQGSGWAAGGRVNTTTPGQPMYYCMPDRLGGYGDAVVRPVSQYDQSSLDNAWCIKLRDRKKEGGEDTGM